ncbi:PAS domain S-box protein [Stella sp.]|uniref:PAS domain S-box protein n=1 Tax=Stella sp. TaxID=2912054 RepID=UPI0035AE7DB5
MAFPAESSNPAFASLPPGLQSALVGEGPVVRYAARLAAGAPLLFVSANAVLWLGSLPRRGRGWSGFVHPEDRRRYAQALRRVAEAGTTEVEYRLLGSDGSIWVRDRLIAADDGFASTVVDITRERQAEARAADATVLMSAMLRSALDAVVTVGEDGRVVEFNPVAERMFGRAHAEAVGTRFSDLVAADAGGPLDDAAVSRWLQGIPSAGTARRLQVTARRGGGGEFQAELTILAVRLDGGTLFVAEFRDISGRVAAERERERSVQRLCEAIDRLPAGFTITGPDDRIVLCNEAAAQAMGRPVEEMIGKKRRELIAKSIPMLSAVDGCAFDGAPGEAARLMQRLCSLDGDSIELQLKSGATMIVGTSRLSDGSLVCVRTDVTAIRQAERAVRDSAELLRKVLEASPVAIKMTRLSDGQIIYQSPASRSLYGGRPDGAPAYARDAFVDPADSDRLKARLLRDGLVDGFEAELRRGDGVRFPAAISARTIEMHGERMVVGCTFDLSERHAVEAELARQREALHQSEKLAALGELLAGVAHELNNPLSVVVGQALLLKETCGDPALVQRLGRLERAADRCVRIVKTFLAMARRRPRRSESLCLNQSIREAVEVAGHALRSSGVGVRMRLARDLPAILGDPDQLAQVLTNLIFNAEIAMREVAGDRLLTLTTAVAEGGRAVVLTVRDTGPGVPPELRARAFEPFFTTRGIGSGTGIGLAFCHRVVEGHGGRITLDGGRTGGAVFTVRLPVGDAAPATPETPAVEPEPAGRRVLVIDDEVDVADVLAAMLRRQGDRVETAMSGGDALLHLRRGTFDLVLSDLRMPGLDGETLYRILAEEQPETVRRLGFITGDAMGSRAQRFLARSGRPYLEKPITPADLSRLVAAIGGGAAGP